MNCRKVTHLLSAYMDGELPGVEHRLIHEHLGRCEDCLADYETLLQMKRLLGRLKVQSAQHNLPLQILQQVHSEANLDSASVSADWKKSLTERLRGSIKSPQTVSLGLGFAVVAMLYMAQFNLSAQPPNVMNVTWQQSPPTVHEFVSGINNADPDRFLSRPASGPYRPVSSESFFNQREAGLFQSRTSSARVEPLVFHTN